jgi:hypothetical protein
VGNVGIDAGCGGVCCGLSGGCENALDGRLKNKIGCEAASVYLLLLEGLSKPTELIPTSQHSDEFPAIA